MTNGGAKKFPELIAYMQARREWYVDLSYENALAMDPRSVENGADRGSLGQMIDGFLAVLHEAHDGASHDTRDFFMETLFPGLVSSGAVFEGLVMSVTLWAVRIAADIGENYKGPDREAAIVWMANFFGGYIGDIARVGAAASYAAKGAP